MIPFAAPSPVLPPPSCFSPIWIIPLRKVPLVSTTVLDWISIPIPVRTPQTAPFLINKPVIISCQKSTFGVYSKANLHSSANRMRSFCDLGDHIAGPLERFNMRNWIMDLSDIMPERPPRASISRIICPLATPPIAGLQDICAMVFIFMVHNSTDEPILAAACAASHPACPAPTTMTSYIGNIYF